MNEPRINRWTYAAPGEGIVRAQYEDGSVIRIPTGLFNADFAHIMALDPTACRELVRQWQEGFDTIRLYAWEYTPDGARAELHYEDGRILYMPRIVFDRDFKQIAGLDVNELVERYPEASPLSGR